MLKPIVMSVICLVVFTWTTHSVQARPGKRFDKGSNSCRVIDKGVLDWESDNWGTGAQKFVQVCKSCHTRNNDKGARFLYMESYGSKGWNNVFSKRRVPCRLNGSWDVLTKNEIMMVNDYLYRNANDTYDPNNAETCG